MHSPSPARTRARRLPVLAVGVLATVVLVAGGSIAADLVGVPLRPPVSDRIRAQVDVERATIPELQAVLEGGRVRSVDLVGLYLERIAAYDEDGPSLNAVIALNPGAYDTARALDVERRRTGPRGPLHGIPVLLKDNIDTADLPTTAGSVVLAGSTPPDDATIARQLRDAGAIVLGKTNLTEFANFMTNGMPGGYSSWGGQSVNPYGAEDSPSGSSAGSGVAAAAGLAAATVGTETSGSILSPARANSLVGLKPTLGLVSRDGIVPIAESQDTAGPMTRSVVDAAVMLGAMTGVDPADPRTQESAGNFETDYRQFLTGESLEGARIGLAANAFTGLNARIAAILDSAIGVLEAEGAVIVEGVDVTAPGVPGVLNYEFKRDLNAYLGAREGAPVRSLAEVIAANEELADEALRFGQTTLVASEAIDLEAEAAAYQANLAAGKAATQGAIDGALEANDLDALLYPQQSAAGIAARAGYPSLVLPIGYDAGDGRAPVGMTFVGTAWTEAELLGFAHDYEQAAQAWRPPSEVNPTLFRCPAAVSPAQRGRPPVIGACPS